jgi:hypothetical protein
VIIRDNKGERKRDKWEEEGEAQARPASVLSSSEDRSSERRHSL